MRTRCCLNCGEPYESEATTDCAQPFCSKFCRKWHVMSEDERKVFVYESQQGKFLTNEGE